MSTQDERIIEMLDQIKRLLILGLIKQGAQGKEIAGVLQVDPAIISRTISPRKNSKKK